MKFLPEYHFRVLFFIKYNVYFKVKFNLCLIHINVLSNGRHIVVSIVSMFIVFRCYYITPSPAIFVFFYCFRNHLIKSQHKSGCRDKKKFTFGGKSHCSRKMLLKYCKIRKL